MSAAWQPPTSDTTYSTDNANAARSEDSLRQTHSVVAAGSADAAWRWCLAVAQERRRANARVPMTSVAAPTVTPDKWHGAARELLDLYAPLWSLPRAQSLAIGHLAQGIDGNIATDSGSSRRLSGELNHTHLHRLRALADAVIVGAATAELDNPALTVRLVSGPNPVRLVIDPSLRLSTRLRLFNDQAAPSFVICAGSNRAAAVTRWGSERVITVDAQANRLDLPALYVQLRQRGWPVVLVEGGGVTVSRMIEAGCLDRVQVAIAPVLVGGTRRGLQLVGPPSIDDCSRPPPRVFRMGEDLLWDLDLRAGRHADLGRADATLNRVL
jgi:diaminohydroxyphosphoribosylaminopyrimidine deaminase / 5-amino-6-(5-phosphoribosylamino)uracil reductase